MTRQPRWYTVTTFDKDGRVAAQRDVRAFSMKHAIALAGFPVPDGGTVKAWRSTGAGILSLLRL